MCPWRTHNLVFLDPGVGFLDEEVGLCFAVQSICINLHTCHQCMTIPVTPYPHQYLVLKVFLILVFLLYMSWYLVVVLIYISLVKNYVENFFIHVSVI